MSDDVDLNFSQESTGPSLSAWARSVRYDRQHMGVSADVTEARKGVAVSAVDSGDSLTAQKKEALARNQSAESASHKEDAPVVRPLRPANDGLHALKNRIIIDEQVPFYMVSAEGVLFDVNAAYEALASEMAGVPPGPGLITKGRPVKREFYRILERVTCSGATVSTEHWCTVQGRRRCWRGRHFPVRDERAEIVAVAGTFFDATSEMVTKQDAILARRRFSDFARATSDWFWETDRSGALTLLSERFAVSAGQPAAIYHGKSIFELAAKDSDPTLINDLQDVLKSQTAFRNLPIEIEAADGTLRRCHLSGVPVFEPSSGAFTGFRGAGMDVTEAHQESVRSALMRRNLEETLEKLTLKNLELDIASAEAESALRAKNEFLAAMSHELRTPLNAIIGFSEAMEMKVFGELNAHYHGYSKDISGAAQHLLGLINDVLDVAVLESDGISVHPRPLSVAETLEQAACLVRNRADDRKLDLSGLRLERDVQVMADERRTTQVFLNLLTNAVKFTPEGGKVGVDLRTGDGKAAITIWDTGIGIPEDMQERVFEKFQQVSDTVYARKCEGTGLGLHISRRLARLMGGDITLISEEGTGSRFTLMLPLAEATE